MKGRVFVGLSGGVDSSVAALLLKRAGYEVAGVFVRSYNIDGCAERDAEDARRVAERLGIPFYVFNFEKEYKRSVIADMVAGYKSGLTPNPDVLCNKEIKFGKFLRRALKLGADYIATGHYVRRRQNNEFQISNFETNSNNQVLNNDSEFKIQNSKFSLWQAKDTNKDQSYFLWTLTQKQLSRSLFPVGEYTKTKIRELAGKAMLSTADKPDSQGICFLGDVPLDKFLGEYILERRGDVVTVEGERVGEHHGAHLYTIGQRHIGIERRRGDRPNQEPYYVVSKDIDTNTVTVAEGSDHPALFTETVVLRGVNHIYLPPTKDISVLARTRYRQPLSRAVLCKEGGVYTLIFDEPQWAVAPGQSAVWYADDGELLGGGVIQ